MKWTLDWLKDYLDTTQTAQTIAGILSIIGLEVEEVREPVVPVAAKITECTDIPGTHLHLLKVDAGPGLPRQVVCGAPNVRVGLLSVLARPGCVVGGNEIKAGKIRGFESNGMMCSEKELGQGDDHSGIMELDEKQFKPGEPLFRSATADCRVVFDASITPNRPDYLAVRGIARDLAARKVGTFKPKPMKALSEIKGARKAVSKNKTGCPAYSFAEIKDTKMAPSGDRIKRRLSAIEINPKNACIDATNYVCYDLGQPMHCFDADQVAGDILIRNAKAGEKFTDLFGVEHALAATDLVIADDKGILALAGIVGGARSMTTDTTKNIILESAYFEPIGIRKTARRLGLKTESSYRYERGIDPTMTGDALASAIEIIQAQCGGEIIGLHLDSGGYTAKAIQYEPKLFLKKVGIDLSPEKQKEILKNLGYRFENSEWIVPSWRVDVEIPETIVADIVRISGYGALLKDPAKVSTPVIYKEVENKNILLLKYRGLIEVITYGFGNSRLEKVVSDKPNIMIANPIVDMMDTARNSLIPNMLNVIAENERRGFSDLALFEIGNVFDGSEPWNQHSQLIMARTGNTSQKHWSKRDRPADIFDIKRDFAALLGADVLNEIKTDNPPKWAHPYKYGRMEIPGTKAVLEFAELHPMVAKKFGIKTNVVLGFVENADRFAKYALKFPMTDFQPIRKDFAFWCDKALPAQKIIKAASVDKLIRDITIFDVFEKDAQKSVAFTITIYPEKNMTDADLQELQGRVIASVEKTGAKIRDK